MFSQTEKEGVAIVWSIEHFHLYLYGHTFTLVSDHQPLETIFNNPKSQIPARITVSYFLNCHCFRHSIFLNIVNIMFCNLCMFEHGQSHIRVTGHIICSIRLFWFIFNIVITAVKTNKWKKSYASSTLDTFSRLEYELTVVPVSHGEILLHDNRIVIPKDLQMSFHCCNYGW
jgi:hypothetical protein